MTIPSTTGGASHPPIIHVRYIQKVNDFFLTEVLECIRKGAHLQLTSIPLYAKRLAVGDLIAAEYDTTDQAFYFDRRILPSGNTTIRIKVTDRSSLGSVEDQLLGQGCQCTIFFMKRMVLVNVPKTIPYSRIKTLLMKGEARSLWQFEEACLSHCVLPEPAYQTLQEIEQDAHLWRQRMAETLSQCRRNRGQSPTSVAFDLDITAAIIEGIESSDPLIPLHTYLLACVYFGITPYDAFKSSSPQKQRVC